MIISPQYPHFISIHLCLFYPIRIVRIPLITFQSLFIVIFKKRVGIVNSLIETAPLIIHQINRTPSIIIHLINCIVIPRINRIICGCFSQSTIYFTVILRQITINSRCHFCNIIKNAVSLFLFDSIRFIKFQVVTRRQRD